MTTRYFKGTGQSDGCFWKREDERMQARVPGTDDWITSVYLTVNELQRFETVTETTAEGEPLKQD